MRDPIGGQYLSFSKEQFDQYLVTPHYNPYASAPRPQLRKIPPSDEVYDAVASIKRVIEHDQSLFIVFVGSTTIPRIILSSLMVIN